MKDSYKTALFLFPAVLIYAWFCYQLNYTQDDAYISYRYVANFLNGDGLVYNVGERIEGFTNFGWVMYLLLWGAIGLPYIIISKLTGIVFGAATIVLTYKLARQLFTPESPNSHFFAMIAAYLVAANQSLAYWSVSGLETSTFGFFALLSLHLYLRRSWLLIGSLLASVMLRPEGALVAGMLVLLGWIDGREAAIFALKCAGIAAMLFVPVIGFKLLYYGSVLPNPFYAKVSFSQERLYDGFEYAARFFKHYGFFGLGLIVPAVFYRRLTDVGRAVLLFSLFYTVYVVLIGGDVLKVHRFFLPVFGSSAVLIVYVVSLLVRDRSVTVQRAVAGAAAIVLVVLTVLLPREFVLTYNRLEKALTDKMAIIAGELKKSDVSDFSVALSTIGIFGYELVGHDIIDMVGLTDSTIARHPETPVRQFKSTWKEQNYNCRYVLSRKPDYIMFSTGVKPSAPAEKALLLYRQFLDGYRTIGWAIQPDPDDPRATIQSIFKRVRDVEGPLAATYPVDFVELYKQGLDAYAAGNQNAAIQYFQSAMEISPQPVYIYLYYHEALSYVAMRNAPVAEFLMDSVVARDSLIFMAHAQLYKYAAFRGDDAKARIHRRWLLKLAPWYVPRLEAQVAEMLENKARQGP
ncbi:MAG: hypothetical protein AB1483_08055 [Candidatus Zixiibacteriota bacterium]